MRRFPLDFAVAAVLVVCGNFLVCDATAPGLDHHIRLKSQRLMLAKLATAVEGRLDLVMFGDSRARQLEVEMLCRALYGAEGRCLNASTMGGDWVTAFQLYRAGAGRELEGSDVLLFPSDYWVEGNERVLLPNAVEYLLLGQTANYVASSFPLSRARGPWMRRIHATLDDGGGALLDRFAPAPARPTLDALRLREMPEAARWRRGNIDQWFAPTSDDQRRILYESGRRALSQLTRDGHDVIMVDLPYPAVRERFVDRFFPGRREKAIRALHRLAEESGVPLIDMRDDIERALLFKDFNHLSYKGLGIATRRLVERLQAVRHERGATPSGAWRPKRPQWPASYDNVRDAVLNPKDAASRPKSSATGC